MSKNIITPTKEFEDVLTPGYKDLVANGPYNRSAPGTVDDLGSFREITEPHPHCAGCGVSLGIRLGLASLPSPENTIIIGTPGCAYFALTQSALCYSCTAFGNQNSVATGLKRMLKIRHPGKVKDVLVMVGDGGVADIGLDYTLHSWFRGENIATVMLDNEVYGNTGGQESGMTVEGKVLNMAPTGKKFPKIPVFEMAKVAGCAYAVRTTVASPKKFGTAVRRAVLIAREVGPTYVQVYTPCPTNLKFSPGKTLEAAKDVEKTYYQYEEYMTEEASAYLSRIGELKEAK
ncbi:MAG: thiamine pyrophosphate-dependent enzyme [Chitinispirillia bacterium]|nr:thiamine pyrophosphate-dependent enzyme [Chitinispirillia bacterium]MCL2240993.1 thiamine pyrophosphate-dependent enzyme [Chitinispirillia bacterium]